MTPPPSRVVRVTAGSLKRLLDCERRLWLSEHSRTHAAPRSDHDDTLGEKSKSLEDRLARGAGDGEMVGPVLVSGVSFEQAAAETLRLLRETRASIRRPVLLSADGTLSASPGFILREGDGLVIRDVRLAHRPEKKKEHRVRTSFAGWLATQLTGIPVVRLEIVNGLGETVAIAPEPAHELEALAKRALELIGDSPEPELLMSHSHCQHCDHYAHCWDQAEAQHLVEVLPSVTRKRAELLHEAGVKTFDQLATLAATQLGERELREAAPVMLAEARAWATGKPVWMSDPQLPADRTLVWFDVEADADGERAQVPVYLWGFAVEPSGSTLADHETPPFEPIIAELTRAGDKAAWARFVARAVQIHEQHPDALWVHWHNAESMWLDRYIAKYGAPQAFIDALRGGAPQVWGRNRDREAAGPRATGALIDLHAAFEKSVRLPVRGTSVKLVAPWMGFAWSNPDADAEWSTAQLHRAYRTKDPDARQAILDEVARYNADDLWAMRVVWRWVVANRPR